MLFTDRDEGGKRLGEVIKKMNYNNPLILAIPRGGVEIAHGIYGVTGIEWDFYMAKKIGAPHNKEVAIAAVDQLGSIYLNSDILDYYEISEDYIMRESMEQRTLIDERLKNYRKGRREADIKGKTIILVDDGIATGTTVMAAAKAFDNLDIQKKVLAVPIAPKETLLELQKVFDEVICLETPEPFYAVGQFYNYFHQLSDERVIFLYNSQF